MFVCVCVCVSNTDTVLDAAVVSSRRQEVLYYALV